MLELPGRRSEKVILGTMRLMEIERSFDDWICFFKQVHDLGITKLHSSSEYESFPLLCEILSAMRKLYPDIGFQHIVKLAEPSFDDAEFVPARMIERIDFYRTNLGEDTIEDIQWMWRHNLDNDEMRVEKFKDVAEKIGHAALKAKEGGSIRRLLCFPYTPMFAEAAIGESGIDGLVVYRNVQELNYEDMIRTCAKLGKDVIVIRPFNAGKVLDREQRSPRELFDFAVDREPIEAGIVSSSNTNHIRQFL